MAKVEANIDELNKLMRMLKKDYIVRIGILGEKANSNHKGSNLTNAELGGIHEQPERDGEKIPRRSFLEDPLKERLWAKIKPMKKIIWKQLFVKNAPDEFFKYMMSEALLIVKGAFETNGYGQWKAITQQHENRRKAKIKSKKLREQFWLNHNILVDTGQLKRSISGKIIKE